MNATPYRRAVVASGHSYGNMTRIMVPLDSDTFAAIRVEAIAKKTSFAQQARLLIRRGLKATA